MDNNHDFKATTDKLPCIVNWWILCEGFVWENKI